MRFGVGKLEGLAAKLDYEIEGLRGRVEEVENGVAEFEGMVGGLEGRVGVLVGRFGAGGSADHIEGERERARKGKSEEKRG